MGVTVRQKAKGKGKPWWVFITHNGKRTSRQIGDKAAAESVASKVRAKIQLGEFGFEGKEKIPTFEEYAKKWLAFPHYQKDSTMEAYRDNLRLHACPALGKKRLTEITRKDLKAFLEELLGKGLSSSTVNAIKAPINMILDHAIDSELIDHNPLNDLKGKNRKKEGEIDEINPLTGEEAHLMLEKSKEYLVGYYYPHLLCALRTGLRIGEIEALQWGDIDFNSRFIEVRRSHRKGRITKTKNKKRRRVDMTPHLAEILKACQVEEKKRALKQGRPVSEWVFADEKGEMLNRVAFMKALFRCLEKAKLRKIRVHDLRHSYATIRLMRGHNIGDVSNQLGHTSISFTYDTYCHWIPGKFKSEVDELDNLHLNAPYTRPEREENEKLNPINSVPSR